VLRSENAPWLEPGLETGLNPAKWLGALRRSQGDDLLRNCDHATIIIGNFRAHTPLFIHSVALLHSCIFLLGFLHGFGLQLLSTLVQPDKEPPCRQERCRRQADRRSIRQVCRGLVAILKDGD
jgi:hypothetical protein